MICNCGKVTSNSRKKLPSEPISSLLRSLDIATEIKLAKATNSQPESDAKEEKNS